MINFEKIIQATTEEEIVFELRQGFDINSVDSKKWTPLHWKIHQKTSNALWYY
jgi:ankyrin repeat protein